ncbi:hypothetical protein E2C01_070037 [Portunus trituberculatus]|uniref:Uncharacterized protein n=1 Tax=Portunus trituberculatus TaxID=210409 RepID=A0A5B7I082_PORTR|nr:hypothetical protein [Portunus trituberculatus]
MNSPVGAGGTQWPVLLSPPCCTGVPSRDAFLSPRGASPGHCLSGSHFSDSQPARLNYQADSALLNSALRRLPAVTTPVDWR